MAFALRSSFFALARSLAAAALDCAELAFALDLAWAFWSCCSGRLLRFLPRSPLDRDRWPERWPERCDRRRLSFLSPALSAFSALSAALSFSALSFFLFAFGCFAASAPDGAANASSSAAARASSSSGSRLRSRNVLPRPSGIPPRGIVSTTHSSSANSNFGLTCGALPKSDLDRTVAVAGSVSKTCSTASICLNQYVIHSGSSSFSSGGISTSSQPLRRSKGGGGGSGGSGSGSDCSSGCCSGSGSGSGVS